MMKVQPAYVLLFLFISTVAALNLQAAGQNGASQSVATQAASPNRLPVESLAGEGVWVSREFSADDSRPLQIDVWFEKQFLGDGQAYRRRAKSFQNVGRRELRRDVIFTLQELSKESFTKADPILNQLVLENKITDLRRHWIVNGFSCRLSSKELDAIKRIPGVRKIFAGPVRGALRMNASKKASRVIEVSSTPAKKESILRPWYVRSLLADRTWNELKATGKGTLNVIHDFNFVFPDHLANNVYQNPKEKPGNGIDDDGNGLIDDCYGYNFALNSSQLNDARLPKTPQSLHGTNCAAIVSGTATDKSPFAFGIAPDSKWAGVIAGSNLEGAVQWSILQGADTYSMSFSIPNLGERRSHWRKVMEHGSYCGIYFVSGAGNFAQTVDVPVQMRTPEDIPDVVFAAAGVGRDLSRTVFSSKGPVVWKTEHYQDGQVQKPEVCAFNQGLPILLPDGTVRPVAINGNSFAGPMFCGAIALMLSADPDLLPWDLKEIITSTAMDVGPAGVDFETGHGLINCYRAVKEVLRRKAIREGRDPKPFAGRVKGDELDRKKLAAQLKNKLPIVSRIRATGTAFKAGVRPGDVIVMVNGKPVDSDLKKLTGPTEEDTLTLTIRRGTETLTMKLGKGNPEINRFGQVYAEPVFK